MISEGYKCIYFNQLLVQTGISIFLEILANGDFGSSLVVFNQPGRNVFV
jgi:hypothetical protein